MTEEIVLVESCQGFWSCIDANTIMISLITLGGVFASSLLTYYLTTRQHKNEVIINHKDFYSKIGGLDSFITHLTVRLSNFENLYDLETLKNDAHVLENYAHEVRDSLHQEEAPYPLRKPLFNMMMLTLQVSSYTTYLIGEISGGTQEPINITDVQKKFKELNKEIKKNHKIIKKYL